MKKIKGETIVHWGVHMSKKTCPDGIKMPDSYSYQAHVFINNRLVSGSLRIMRDFKTARGASQAAKRLAEKLNIELEKGCTYQSHVFINNRLVSGSLRIMRDFKTARGASQAAKRLAEKLNIELEKG